MATGARNNRSLTALHQEWLGGERNAECIGHFIIQDYSKG